MKIKELVNIFYKTAMIKLGFIKKMPNGKYCVFSEAGKNMGTYNSKEQAKKRLRQIEFFKHKKASKSIDLSDVDNLSLSAVMRKLKNQLSEKEIIQFLKCFNFFFKKLICENKNPEGALKLALEDLNNVYKITLNDENDIVDGTRDPFANMGQNAPYSFSPVLDYTKSPVYNTGFENPDYDQDQPDEPITEYLKVNETLPISGEYGNDGINSTLGFGYTSNPGGLLYP